MIVLTEINRKDETEFEVGLKIDSRSVRYAVTFAPFDPVPVMNAGDDLRPLLERYPKLAKTIIKSIEQTVRGRKLKLPWTLTGSERHPRLAA